MLRTLIAPTVLAALAGTASAQEVGSFVETVELEDFAQTKAKSMNDYLGRAVLIEFFAYW